jgi:hypothetical protein
MGQYGVFFFLLSFLHLLTRAYIFWATFPSFMVLLPSSLLALEEDDSSWEVGAHLGVPKSKITCSCYSFREGKVLD